MSELLIDKPEIYYDCISSQDMNQFLGGGESSVRCPDVNKTKSLQTNNSMNFSNIHFSASTEKKQNIKSVGLSRVLEKDSDVEITLLDGTKTTFQAPTKLYEKLVGSYKHSKDSDHLLKQILLITKYWENKIEEYENLINKLQKYEWNSSMIKECQKKIAIGMKLRNDWTDELKDIRERVEEEKIINMNNSFPIPRSEEKETEHNSENLVQKFYQLKEQSLKTADQNIDLNNCASVCSALDKPIRISNNWPSQSLKSEGSDTEFIEEEVTQKKDLKTKLSVDLQIQTKRRDINQQDIISDVNYDQEILPKTKDCVTVSSNNIKCDDEESPLERFIKSVSVPKVMNNLELNSDKALVTNKQRLKDNSPNPETQLSKLKPDHQQESISTPSLSKEKLKCGNTFDSNKEENAKSFHKQLYPRFVGQFKKSKDIHLLYKRILKIEKLFSMKISKFSNYLTIIRKLSMDDHLIKSIESQIKIYETLCGKWCSELKTSIHQIIIEELKEEILLFEEIEIDSERHLISETIAGSYEESQAVHEKTSNNIILKPNEVERKVNLCSSAINTEHKQNRSTNTIVKPQILSSMSEFHQKFLGNVKTSRNFEKNVPITFEMSTQTDNGIDTMSSFKPKSKESTIICMNCDRKGHFFKNWFSTPEPTTDYRKIKATEGGEEK